MASNLVIAKGDIELALLPSMANRHGLVAGATGTGKTVTLQKIAGELSNIGVPVFMADIKGDLSGISRPGGNNPKVEDRIKTLSRISNTKAILLFSGTYSGKAAIR